MVGIDVADAQIAPFYLLFDVSYSMAYVMQELNDALRDLKNKVLADPLLADIARVSLITFSDTATVVIPMSDLATDTIIDSYDILTPQGGTSFAAAFTELKERIEHDVADLKRENRQRKIVRPVVFFVTDGDPVNDTEQEWRSAFHDLTSAPIAPNVLPLGFGEVQERNLAATVWPRKHSETFYFIKKQGVKDAQAIKKIMKVVTDSVVYSARSVGEGNPDVIIKAEETQDTLKRGFVLDEV